MEDRSAKRGDLCDRDLRERVTLKANHAGEEDEEEITVISF